MLRLSFLLLVSFFSCSIFLLGCRNTEITPATGTIQVPRDTIHVAEVTTEGAALFKVVEGTVFWSGQPAFGNPHNGTIQVNGGELLVHQGQIVRGTVTINMQSIMVTDIADGSERRDLEVHLKHADFFDSVKYPTGEFKFDQVLPSNLPAFNWVVSGGLTLKGKTNPINIPVKVTIDNGEIMAQSPNFSINRTQWGINFRSGLLGTSKDKLIQDMILLSLKLKGQRIN